MTETQTAIRGFIVDELQQGIEPEFLDSNTQLIEEELIDSLGIMALVSFIENHWKVDIDPEEVLLDNFETIDAIERLVISKRA